MTSAKPMSNNLVSSSALDNAFKYNCNLAKILAFLSRKSEKTATESEIANGLVLEAKDAVRLLGALVENGFVSHYIQGEEHYYRLLTLDWVARIEILPTNVQKEK
jgi:hypothetical protein